MKRKIFIVGVFCLFIVNNLALGIQSELEFKSKVKKIFGIPKDNESSGIHSTQSIQYGKTDNAIWYRFFPLGLYKFEDELGVDLAPKIKKLFETCDEIVSVVFLILGPFQDNYGNITWKPVLSFEFTRTIYNKINWNNFIKQDLLKTAKEVNWFRK